MGKSLNFIIWFLYFFSFNIIEQNFHILDTIVVYKVIFFQRKKAIQTWDINVKVEKVGLFTPHVYGQDILTDNTAGPRHRHGIVERVEYRWVAVNSDGDHAEYRGGHYKDAETVGGDHTEQHGGGGENSAGEKISTHEVENKSEEEKGKNTRWGNNFKVENKYIIITWTLILTLEPKGRG